MSKIDDGGTAFPLVVRHEKDEYSAGMSLRDYFAAKAIAPLIRNMHEDVRGHRLVWFWENPDEALMVAKDAYVMADAMLAARKEGK